MSASATRSCLDFKSPLLWAILTFLFFYWGYLAIVTQPILVYDAKGYEDLGRMLLRDGWKGYFVSGPNREPLYPFLIASSMKWGGEDYHPLLIGMQILFLFITVILLTLLLKRANVAKGIAAVTILYAGISPALVNSALSQYSEIVTYVFVLLIVLFGAAAWKNLKYENGNPLLYGILVGLAFMGATSAKGMYEIVFFPFLIPFGLLAFRNKRVFKQTLLFLFTVIVIYQGCLSGYKFQNLKHNGLFTLTDRGAWALYGNTARRQEPLTLRRFTAGLAYNLLEEEHCAAILGYEDCHFWDVSVSDRLAEEKNLETIATVAPKERDRHLLKLSADKILRNPSQYVVLTSFDWIHMFFWESTRIGFVAYPDWLDAIYDHPVFSKVLRGVIGLLSLISTLWILFLVIRNKFAEQPEIFLAVYLIVLHVSFYSLFATVARFAFPVVPLMIFAVAVAVQQRLQKS